MMEVKKIVISGGKGKMTVKSTHPYILDGYVQP